jgi:predicted amidohydrolase
MIRTIAAATMQVVHDKKRNLERYRDFIREAAMIGTDLLVLPEQSLQGYIWGLAHEITSEEREYHFAESETVPGPTTGRLAALAKKNRMTIVFGMTERDDRALHNSAVVVTPGGSVRGFRKVHLPGDEALIYGAGDNWPIFETPVGRLGILICYDALFPESTRELTLGGAEILVMPTAWPRFTNYPDREKDANSIKDTVAKRYFACNVARALENQRVFVAANQVGVDDKSGIEYAGHSQIVAPSGLVIADSGDGEGLAVAKVDTARATEEAIRDSFDYLKDRASESYRLTRGY